MAAGNDYKITKLNENNYYSWSIRIKAVMIQKGQWCAISPGYSTTMTASEQIINDKALADIILTVEDNVLDELAECTRAKEAWEALEEAFTKYGLLHALHVRRDLHNSKKTEAMPMLSYINDIVDKNRRLKNSGFAFDDREQALLILMGLPATYDQLILHFEHSEESLSTKEVKRKLLLEEKRVTRREEDSVTIETEAAMAYRTQQHMHQGRKEPLQQEGKTAGNFKRYVKCFCCGAGGHIARDCYFNPESPNYKGKKNDQTNERGEESKSSEARLTKNMERCNIEYTALCVKSNTPHRTNFWYLDSAADEYMCNDINKFEDMQSCSRTVRVADERVLSVKGTGTIKIKLCDKNGGRHLIMKDVSYIPELTDNLLSVGKLTEANITLTFRNDQVTAMRGGDVIFTGQRHGRMYRVYEDSLNAKLTRSEDFELLHRRMGHLGPEKIKRILKAQGTYDSKPGNETCRVCIKGKMKKRTFPSSTTRATHPLQLIHSDVMGPVTPKSKGGARYIVTFTDDYSRYSTVYFMTTKDEVLEKFKQYHKIAEVKTGSKLKTLRSDNGREYVNRKFDEYLRNQGISRQLTVPYNPQQNGTAERLNQTLLNMARCLMIEGNLPKELWAEAVHTACYLRNRSPLSVIENRTPADMWGEEKVNYEHLRVFGCQAWRYLEKEKRTSKFDERARSCIFLGYPDGIKGFKVWDLEEHRFYVSRDIKFEEHVFPFQTNLNKMPEEQDEDILFIVDNNEDEGTNENGQEEMSRVEQTEVLSQLSNKQESEEQVRNCEEITGTSEVRLRCSQRIKKPKMCLTCNEEDQGHCNHIEHMEGEDPKTLREALEGPDAERWKRAMEREMTALEGGNTWEIIRRPKDAHVIQGKWVFKKKKNERNEVIEFKARLVARGFQQIPDLEFDEVYSPVVKLKSVRLILSIAAQRKWPVYHFDIASAYLNGILDKTVLMEHPQMTLNQSKESEWVCSLNKGLYGLKQGGRQWNQSIDEFLQKCELQRAKSDPCVYFNCDSTLFLALHVDDVMMTCRDEEKYQQFGDRLKKRYKSKDLGKVKHLLSMRVTRGENGDITIDQCHFIQELLKHYKMEDVRPASTPIDKGVKFKRSNKGNKKEKSVIPYRQLLGSLMYLANCTRPDLSFVTSYMGQFNESFDSDHWTSLQHILRYLQKTKDLKLTYRTSDKKLHGYCDADWGSDLYDRKSFGGYVFRLASGAVTWCSRKQRVTALSSTEAEFLQMVQAAREAIWLRSLLTELRCEELLPETVTLLCDNQGAIYMANNDVVTDRAKHIDIGNFFIRDHVKNGEVSFEYVPTGENVADALTKIMPKHGYELFYKETGMC